MDQRLRLKNIQVVAGSRDVESMQNKTLQIAITNLSLIPWVSQVFCINSLINAAIHYTRIREVMWKRSCPAPAFRWPWRILP